MSVVLHNLALPEQTQFTHEHAAGFGGLSVEHSLSGRPFIFPHAVGSSKSELVFGNESAWLSVSQRTQLFSMVQTTQSMTLSVRGVEWTVIFDVSASGGAIQLAPVMPFCDKFYGSIHLVILGSA
jgi:hypothetical protein